MIVMAEKRSLKKYEKNYKNGIFVMYMIVLG